MGPEEDMAGVNLAELLMEVGVTKKLAKTLYFFSMRREGYSQEIQELTDLRQPEVSIALREMRERGWITTIEEKNPHKGPPIHRHILSRPVEEIVRELAEEKRTEVERLQRVIDALTSLEWGSKKL